MLPVLIGSLGDGRPLRAVGVSNTLSEHDAELYALAYELPTYIPASVPAFGPSVFPELCSIAFTELLVQVSIQRYFRHCLSVAPCYGHHYAVSVSNVDNICWRYTYLDAHYLIQPSLFSTSFYFRQHRSCIHPRLCVVPYCTRQQA